MTSVAHSADRSFRVSGNLIDVHQRRIFPATVVVQNGWVVDVCEDAAPNGDGYLAPGFVDAHVHVESSLLPPSEFARLAVAHGTVATVSDPHEIGNVLGSEGVAWMLADAAMSVLKIRFGAPSCVPATPFDRSGAVLGPAEIEELLAWPGIGYLSEMMNYPGAIAGQEDVLAKIAAARRAGLPVDGHAPGLVGPDLATYVGRGIMTDHECVALDEAREKQSLGMKILIREGSAAKNFEKLWPLLLESPESCMLCSDDKHPNDLVESHIDALVRRALANGADLFDVWRAASVHPVEHYGLQVGLLRPGDPADFIEIANPREPRVLRTWIDGRLVAEQGRSLIARHLVRPVNRFAAHFKLPQDFALSAEGVLARAIQPLDGQLITREVHVEPTLCDGLVVADAQRDILKMALVDRYRDTQPAVVLSTGFGLRHGALASSVSHDSHNIVAVGADDESLARAINAVIETGGGLSVATPAGGVQVLSLPIAGLMSDADGYRVAADYARLDALAKSLGSPLTAPFMTLSFMALLVIPALKIGPTGLFDVTEFRPVSMWVG
ncbi:MAG: adenine deaminase [Pirellulales bacterium]